MKQLHPLLLIFLGSIVSFSGCRKKEVIPQTLQQNNPGKSSSPMPSDPKKGNTVPLPSTNPPTTSTPPPVTLPPIIITPLPVFSKSSFITISGVPVYKEKGGGNAFFYQTGMTIDADGAFQCYHANSSLALSPLEMAGYPGNWWGLVTDSAGNPCIQGKNDPAPGYYISQTSLEDQSMIRTDPHRYVDALAIPYLVLPPQLKKTGGANLGDFGAMYNKNNDKISFAIFADEGPESHIGEASIAAAHNLGYELINKMGGAENGIIYVVFPGSGNRKKRTVSEINANGASLLEAWGGLQKLKEMMK
jgi:hypothetical protein